MKSEDMKTDADCPSKEELSNWYDNGGDSGIDAHVEECRSCVETVGFYRKVDETVRMSTMPPSYLAGNIVEACHGVQGEALAFPLWMRALRMAATVAVIGTVAGAIYLVTSPGVPGRDNVIAATAGDTAEVESPIVAEFRTDPRFEGHGRNGSPGALPDLAAVGSGDLVAVSAAGGLGDAVSRPGRAKPLVRIADDVRHVWVVNDLQTSQEIFQAVLPDGVSLAAKTAEGDSKLAFEAAMSDVQLQQVVDALKNRGWALFTKNYPQPGEADRVDLTGRKVNYFVDLVNKASD